jgi:sulfane dehydrogenase subunit SoxC
VRKVEVSTDGGRTWRDARLQEPIHRIAHTRFRLPWTWDGRECTLQSRCTDDRGYVQPSIADLARIRGVHSLNHLNAIQSWKVTAPGVVLNVRA